LEEKFLQLIKDFITNVFNLKYNKKFDSKNDFLEELKYQIKRRDTEYFQALKELSILIIKYHQESEKEVTKLRNILEKFIDISTKPPIRNKIEDSESKIFGVSITKLKEPIPLIISQLMDWVEENCLNEVGLFRIPGNFTGNILNDGRGTIAKESYR
jgi:cellulose biosynthesis protein BcsQ